jgi:hypothetical protein
MSTTSLTERDLEFLKNGREFERLDIIEALEKQAKALLRTNPEHALHIGFIIQAIKDMKHV